MPYTDRIASLDLLDRCFVRRKDSDLRSYAAQSFGAFQEESLDVVLRVAPEAADNAASSLFHPSQTVTREAGGALRVAFRAGGVQEMCWRLFTWGTAIILIALDSLRLFLAKIASAAAAHHSPTVTRLLRG